MEPCVAWVLMMVFLMVIALICTAKYNKWKEEQAKKWKEEIERDKTESLKKKSASFDKKLISFVEYDINHPDILWNHFYCFIVASLGLLGVEVKLFLEDEIALETYSVDKDLVEVICNSKPRDTRMNWQQDLVSRLRTLTHNPEVLTDVANSIPDSVKHDCIDEGSTKYWYYVWSFVLKNEQCVCWFKNYINALSEHEESIYNEYIRNHPLEYTLRSCTREIVDAINNTEIGFADLSWRTDSALSAIQAEFDRQNDLITTAAVASIAQHILK